MSWFVYIITNVTNGKVYVGKASNPQSRFKSHVKKAAANSMLALHCAMRLHGPENFTLTVVSEHESEEETFAEESRLIGELGTMVNGYNMNEGGRGGSNPTQEVRDKISRSLKGRHHTEESKEKMREACKTRPRRPHSEETKAKMRATRQRMREEGRDRLSDAAREKLRLAWERSPDRKPWNAGTHGAYSDDYRDKIGAGHRGIPLSEEHRRKLSEAAGRRRMSSQADVATEDNGECSLDEGANLSGDGI